jgi:hypothetical protein
MLWEGGFLGLEWADLRLVVVTPGMKFHEPRLSRRSIANESQENKPIRLVAVLIHCKGFC